MRRKRGLPGEATHRGPWRGIAPTGRRISYTGILILRFEGRKIAEFRAQPDLPGLLQQLGTFPPAAGSSGGSGCLRTRAARAGRRPGRLDR